MKKADHKVLSEPVESTLIDALAGVAIIVTGKGGSGKSVLVHAIDSASAVDQGTRRRPVDLDARAFDDFTKQNLVVWIELFQFLAVETTILSDDDARAFGLSALPAMTDLLRILAVNQTIEDRHSVIDSPSTGHFLRLLDSADELASWAQRLIDSASSRRLPGLRSAADKLEGLLSSLRTSLARLRDPAAVQIAIPTTADQVVLQGTIGLVRSLSKRDFVQLNVCLIRGSESSPIRRDDEAMVQLVALRDELREHSRMVVLWTLPSLGCVGNDAARRAEGLRSWIRGSRSISSNKSSPIVILSEAKDLHVPEILRFAQDDGGRSTRSIDSLSVLQQLNVSVLDPLGPSINGDAHPDSALGKLETFYDSLPTQAISSFQLAFVVGAGGAGKSTHAVALGLVRQRRFGDKGLILSIDPAHSLGLVCRRDFGHDETILKQGLGVHEFDIEAARERFVEAADAELSGTHKLNDSASIYALGTDFRAVISIFPPAFAEIIGLLHAVERLGSSNCRFVIVDTPPITQLVPTLAALPAFDSWLKLGFSILLRHRSYLHAPRTEGLLISWSKALKRYKELVKDTGATRVHYIARAAELSKSKASKRKEVDLNPRELEAAGLRVTDSFIRPSASPSGELTHPSWRRL